MEAATVIQAEDELIVVEKPMTSAAIWAEDQLAVVMTPVISRTQRLDSTRSSGEEGLGVLIRGHPNLRMCFGQWKRTSVTGY